MNVMFPVVADFNQLQSENETQEILMQEVP